MVRVASCVHSRRSHVGNEQEKSTSEDTILLLTTAVQPESGLIPHWASAGLKMAFPNLELCGGGWTLKLSLPTCGFLPCSKIQGSNTTILACLVSTVLYRHG